MLNKILLKLALDSGVVNYIDNETPPDYFISHAASLWDLNDFAHAIIDECLNCFEDEGDIDYVKFLIKCKFEGK